MRLSMSFLLNFLRCQSLHMFFWSVSGIFRQDIRTPVDSEGAVQLGEPLGAAESSSGLERSQSLFGRPSEHFDDASAFDFQSEMNFSALAASSPGCDADGYQDPEWELEEPQTAEQTARFATVIEDHCLSVPPVMTVKLPWETGVMETIFGVGQSLPA